MSDSELVVDAVVMEFDRLDRCFRLVFFAKVKIFNPTCQLQQSRNPTGRLDLG